MKQCADEKCSKYDWDDANESVLHDELLINRTKAKADKWIELNSRNIG